MRCFLIQVLYVQYICVLYPVNGLRLFVNFCAMVFQDYGSICEVNVFLSLLYLLPCFLPLSLTFFLLSALYL